MKEVDETAHAATMQANGNDRRGQGGANATINSKLTETRPAGPVSRSTPTTTSPDGWPGSVAAA